MKRNLLLTSIGIIAIFLFIAGTKSVAQDKKVKEEHIKIVKIDSKGKKTELDTVITNGNVFIWNGDTIGNKQEFKWQPRKGVRIDSIHKATDNKFEYEITEGDNGKVIIMKGSKVTGPAVYGFVSEGDSSRKVKIIRHQGPGQSTISFSGSEKPVEVRGYPIFPPEARWRNFNEEKQSNKIDLSDPGIISYEKKKLKGGREKITIIRNEVKNEDIKVIHEGNKVIRIRDNSENGGQTIDVNVETKERKK